MSQTRVEYGSFEPAGELFPVTLEMGLAASCQHWVWRPNHRILCGVQPDATVNFGLMTLPNGQCRFQPWNHMKVFSRSATLNGFSILRHRCAAEMNGDGNEDYQLMLKMHDRLPATQAYLERQLSSLTELPVRPSGRDGDRRNRCILPAHLGKQADGRGRKWTIEKFVENGKLRIEADDSARCGFLRPTKKVSFNGRAIIAYGLMAAAERNPLKLEESRISSLIRMALVDAGMHWPSDPEGTLVRVTARLRASWNAHLEDTDEAFTRWFQGGSSNLEQTLANRAGMEGGRLHRDDVKWALTQLSADSLWFAASCQSLFSQAILKSISPQLAADDLAIFRQWYQPQAYLGGLTLPIIWARAPLLRPILSRIWVEPENHDLHSVLWRVLEFYSQMVIPRRYADCCIKGSKRRQANAEWIAAEPIEPANELAELLAVRAGVICRTTRCSITYQCQVDASTILLTGVCARHGLLTARTVPLDEVRRILLEAKKE